MLPLSLLNASTGLEIQVECKSGRIYSGKLNSCDLQMNILLENATCTEKGEPVDCPSDAYLRGYSVKFVKIPDHLLDDIVEERIVKRQELRQNNNNNNNNNGRVQIIRENGKSQRTNRRSNK